ncbi:MAG: sugar phosphorylase [Gammaproteobacteria bacterium]
MNEGQEGNALDNLSARVIHHLESVYPDADCAALCQTLISIMGLTDPIPLRPHRNIWDQHDIAVITYADTIADGGVPLQTLKSFLDQHLGDLVSIVHILPFYPYSSDDGFAVIDYSAVNESHGSWEDVRAIADEYKLMADLVINHVSARSRWFENFKQGKTPGKNYFISVPVDTDVSQVVRPRMSPLLTAVKTVDAEKHVWCTFSSDQVDLNFANPEVLIEFAKIIALYLERGVRWFRLDAVAFLWKELGTSCIHLPQTHEIIKLLRLLIESRQSDAVIITETNVPNRENLTYFGNANQAHLIYNFSLPPLMVHTLISEDCRHLKTWLMSMPPPQQGSCYLNFIASHDGIGVRPLEGLLSEAETSRLLDTMQKFGGAITYRELKGERKPYEINIALFDALSGPVGGKPDEFQVARFICAHAIMLALEGIPAFYMHSLFATCNDHERVQHTGRLRSINRHIWQREALEKALGDSTSHHKAVFERLGKLIEIRKSQSAFHPNATQFTLHLGTNIFGFWRQSIDRQQSIFAVHNVTRKSQTIALSELNLIDMEQWYDLISNERIEDIRGEITLGPFEALWLTNK